MRWPSLVCLHLRESVQRHKRAAEKVLCSRVLGRLGGTERVYSARQQEKESKEKKKKENSPSEEKTWKINKKRHINNGKSTVDSLQFNLFILWKYKGPREERKGKAYGQASTFWWAPSWLGRDARIIYTRIQTPALTENLYSDDEALCWLECRFHQPLALPSTHTHTHTQIQPFTHVPRNGPDLRGESEGQRTAFRAPCWWRERVTTGEIRHEASGKTVKEEGSNEQKPLAQPWVRHTCACTRTQSWPVFNVNVQSFKRKIPSHPANQNCWRDHYHKHWEHLKLIILTSFR